MVEKDAINEAEEITDLDDELVELCDDDDIQDVVDLDDGTPAEIIEELEEVTPPVAKVKPVVVKDKKEPGKKRGRPKKVPVVSDKSEASSIKDVKPDRTTIESVEQPVVKKTRTKKVVVPITTLTSNLAKAVEAEAGRKTKVMDKIKVFFETINDLLDTL